MLKMQDVNVRVSSNLGEVQILKNINLTLEKNKIYVITGPNGGGKSTIGKSIMGIYQVQEGDIFLEEEKITSLSITERAKRGIGYAFQTPARFKGLKVEDLLKLAAKDNPVNLYELLYDVGLCAQDYLHRDIDSTISGGELKRIEIASILAQNPKVAVFDEPEAGIDLWSFQRLTETFENLHKKYETTIVIISHQERILKLADQVILVKDGEISEITSHEKFLQHIAILDSECSCHNNCVKGGVLDVDNY